MYICICKELKESDIKEIVDRNNCKTICEVAICCGAGSKCGKCLDEVENLIKESKKEPLCILVD